MGSFSLQQFQVWSLFATAQTTDRLSWSQFEAGEIQQHFWISDASVAFLCQQIFQFLPKTFSSDTLSLSLHRVLHKVLQINGRATIMPIIFENYQKLFSSDVKLGFLKKYELQGELQWQDEVIF